MVIMKIFDNAVLMQNKCHSLHNNDTGAIFLFYNSRIT